MAKEAGPSPELLKSLGRVVSAVPPERPTYDSLDAGGIVKPLNPPRAYEFGIDLTPPKK